MAEETQTTPPAPAKPETCPAILAAIDKVSEGVAGEKTRILNEPTLVDMKRVWNTLAADRSYSPKGKMWNGKLFGVLYKELEAAGYWQKTLMSYSKRGKSSTISSVCGYLLRHWNFTTTTMRRRSSI